MASNLPRDPVDALLYLQRELCHARDGEVAPTPCPEIDLAASRLTNEHGGGGRVVALKCRRSSGAYSYYADGVRLVIDGTEDAGTVENPDVRALRRLAAPAPFGRGGETVLDPSVRSGWEIPARRIGLVRGGSGRDGEDGERVTELDLLRGVLSDLSDTMGTPSGCLVPVLYKLHLYEEGGKFERHRDTCHGGTHVATAILALGGGGGEEGEGEGGGGGGHRHRGGDLVIHDAGSDAASWVWTTAEGEDRLRLRSPEAAGGGGGGRGGRGGGWSRCDLVAFYTDCPHEVRPVTSGARVVLQFDLHVVPRRVNGQASLLADSEEQLRLAGFFPPPPPPPSGDDDEGKAGEWREANETPEERKRRVCALFCEHFEKDLDNGRDRFEVAAGMWEGDRVGGSDFLCARFRLALARYLAAGRGGGGGGEGGTGLCCGVVLRHRYPTTGLAMAGRALRGADVTLHGLAREVVREACVHPADTGAGREDGERESEAAAAPRVHLLPVTFRVETSYNAEDAETLRLRPVRLTRDADAAWEDFLSRCGGGGGGGGGGSENRLLRWTIGDPAKGAAQHLHERRYCEHVGNEAETGESIYVGALLALSAPLGVRDDVVRAWAEALEDDGGGDEGHDGGDAMVKAASRSLSVARDVGGGGG